MVKKLVDTFKTMALVLACILIPLLIGIYFLQSAAKNDAQGCVDSFIIDEGTGLSKYISLQFKYTPEYIQSICTNAIEAVSENQDTTKKNLAKIIEADNKIAAINVYRSDGKAIATTLENLPDDLDIKDELYHNMSNNILFSMEQLEDSDEIVIKYLLQKTEDGKDIIETETNIGNQTEKNIEKEAAKNDDKKSNENKENNKDKSDAEIKTKDDKDMQVEQMQKKVFYEIMIKWNQYENYMMNMNEGSFPRSFYIISPDCRRYISMNTLPSVRKNIRTTAALGLHLVKKLKSISDGLSEIKIDSTVFKVYKEEIKLPAKMKGEPFFIIIATDRSTVDEMLETLLNRIPSIIITLIVVWSLICLVLARFYNKTKEQLEISTTITTSTPLAIAIFSAADGKIKQINMSAMTLFKIEKDAVSEVDFWKLFLYDEDRHYISNAISSNVNVLNYEVLAQSYSGGSFWSVCSASPIEIEEEQCIILAALDINRRKEVEKKLANNAALLEAQIKERTADLEIKAKELEESNLNLEKSRLAADEANAAKSKFLANMSNELKTPLNAIIGYAEILEEEALDRKDTVSADDLRKIVSSAKHLLSLIEEILDLSSIESGKTQLFFENIEIANLVKDVESVTMPLITKNDNSLFIETGKDIGAMYTDTTKLRQCLLNLLSNSAKFTQFGKITLRVVPLVKNGIDFVEFSVIDSGAGIAPNRIETIFDSFQDNQSKNSGAGLGLSVTKKYIDVLGGTVSVESELGIGSKFTIRIPRKAEIESSDTVIVKNNNNTDNETTFEDDSFFSSIESDSNLTDDTNNDTNKYSLSTNDPNKPGGAFG
ncbi:MAG: PAS domain S-box protein [Alphaproteobacteria bacterium]|nr:PAS domain S-box protein [Alphaproteobacteria bacterium]